ncbi:MAG: DNA helicase (Rad25 homolog) [uncultured Thermomicrobiales bacterium]|uniref:DNA helicase (Rad25 homolog) n=1 Tax=uncultured Thermomicrobiales bacterium TaxID=1645740 RepID=A0A6J4UNU0_9BACT|nr:MAG: DNA helicase (Rad25 homolog) [uncultured Thermomicrobiales bacterium]
MPRPFVPGRGGWGSRRHAAAPASSDAPVSDGDVAEDREAEGELEDLFAALAGEEADGAPDEPLEDDREAPDASGAPAAAASSAAPAEPGLDGSTVVDLVTPGVRATHGLARPAALALTPRPYQEEAVAAWSRQGGRGVVVLPTGAGKTVVALTVAARLGLRTLVVVPTIELLHQWRTGLAEKLGYPLDEVGIVGGGKRTVRDLTVITYDSAAMPSRRLDGFGLLVVDEVHHLPARAYRGIAGKVNAPFRLGLSATPERSDDGHEALGALVGPVVFRRSPAELSRDRYIASYKEKRIFVDLTSDEQIRYDQLMAEYKFYLASRRGSLGRSEGMFVEMIRRSGHDPAARSALRAHHQARMIALNADAKIAKVVELLVKHRDDKVIVFSEYNAMVDVLSEQLLLPAITYRTAPAERRQTLERFRSGEYGKLVTGRVLNEGVDVPDANVAIVVSGSSATREYIQRLGRILRPKASEAQLYELVTRRTTEGRSARRRRPVDEVDPDRLARRLAGARADAANAAETPAA